MKSKKTKMTLIDSNGNVFGKINIIDLLVILLIIAVCWVLYQYYNGQVMKEVEAKREERQELLDEIETLKKKIEKIKLEQQMESEKTALNRTIDTKLIYIDLLLKEVEGWYLNATRISDSDLNNTFEILNITPTPIMQTQYNQVNNTYEEQFTGHYDVVVTSVINSNIEHNQSYYNGIAVRVGNSLTLIGEKTDYNGMIISISSPT